MASSIQYYEEQVARQTAQLDRMKRPSEFDDEGLDEDVGQDEEVSERAPAFNIEDMMKEEEEIKDLERKKRGLEDRVTGMEKDLGGLMR